jgi:basic membrane lipoprotein Med (substrate-binding protein (PBP1-ABC) superfamily)
VEGGDGKNTIGYRGYMEEPHYLCGIAAGRTTKTGKLGFIGGKPIFIFNNCKRPAVIMATQSIIRHNRS